MDSETKRIFYPVTVALLFSGAYISANYTLIDLGPLTTSFLRYGVALVFLGLLLPFMGTQTLKIQPKDIFKLFLLGLTGIVGYHYFFLVSLKHTEIANTAIINATSPILTAVAAAVFIREKLSRTNYLGIGIAFVGVLILLFKGSPDNLTAFQVNTGDAIMLLATLSWVAYALIVRTLTDRYSGFTITLYTTLFGAALLFLLALTENMGTQIRHISKESVYGILYMGIASSGLAYLLYNLSVHEIGPTRTSSFVYSLVQIFVAGLAYLFFRQTVTPVMGLSMALIIFALRFMLRPKS